MKIKSTLDTIMLDAIISSATGQAAPAMRALVRWRGETVYSACSGWLDPETRQRPVSEDTLFDLASVSKLFTTATFMTLVEDGKVSLDQSVCTLLPQFSGLRPIRPYEDPLRWGEYVEPEPLSDDLVDAGQVTFRNLLAHNSGLPAWRPFKDQPDAAAACRMALESDFFYLTGRRVVYSDVGLILTGMAIEQLTGVRLDEAMRVRVTVPLGLNQTRYLPLEGQPYDTRSIAPTEFCAMRQYRVLGEVHDESTWRLGGIAGHAGVFSTAPELARFGQVLLDGGAPLLQLQTLAEMTRLQAQDGDVRRGIGFSLRSPDLQSFNYPFSPRSFGHTGFTGTSIWIDPEYQLMVVLLTNRVYCGRDPEAITRLRVAFHHAVVNGFSYIA
jgi:CubicO group peptidase (beta-lactamase class C family)